MAAKKSVQKKSNNTSNKIMNKNASKSKKNQTTIITNSQKKNKKNKDQKVKDKIPEYVSVPNQDVDDDLVVSEDDLEFFSENKGFTSFLTNLDSKELTKNVKKERKTPAKKPVKEQNEGLDSSSEEEFDSEEDLDNFEEVTDDDNEEELDLDDEEQMNQLLAEAEEEHNLNKKAKKKTTSNESDEEMEYELKPRKVANEWTKKDYHNKLPIKLPGGKIAQVKEEEAKQEEEVTIASDVEQEDFSTKEEEEKVEDHEEDEQVEEEPKLSKREYLIKIKEELATIASDLQADPEENITQLKKLRDMYKKEENATIKKLILLTQLAVYKDIIPGYRIRPLTALEEQTQVSKEVKRMRDYEKTLLNNYEAYLKDLNALLTKKKTEEDASMAMVATRCLCELLVSKTHFNFRLEIMVAVVTRMSSVKWNEAAQLCSEALVTVFENDESGKASLDAIKMIIRMIKSKGYVIHENVINIFLHLRLRDEMALPHAKKDEEEQVGKKRKNKNKPFLTKKARKTLKETKEIEKEFQEAEAVVSKEEKEKNHTETLKLMFAFYFKILKKQTSSPLLPAVLEGLSRYAHLINVDFFDDLLNALREVMQLFEDSNAISRTSSGTRKRLLCIITAFQLLSGQGEALNYDLKDFYKEIYKILFKATFHTKIEEKPDSQKETESEMLIKGLELMFLKKRQIPIDRLAAFIKRFALVALHMPNKTVLHCLALVHRLIQKDHRLDALLQSEDRASSGIYAPLLEDPELCNPFGTSLYELFLYQNHYDPQVRNLAKVLQQPTQ